MRKISPYASYQGRISRSTFWQYTWPFFAILLILACVDGMAFGISGEQGFLLSLASFVLLIPLWRLCVKRCHDRNHSGIYLYLVGMIPVIGYLWLVVELGLLEGTHGRNSFGPDPVKAATA